MPQIKEWITRAILDNYWYLVFPEKAIITLLKVLMDPFLDLVFSESVPQMTFLSWSLVIKTAF